MKKKNPPMTRLEKKQVSQLKKKQSDVKKIKKKVATTLEWCDIKEILPDRINLEKGNKKESIKGIKLTPHNIFLDERIIQARLIDSLKIAHNKIRAQLFYGFVYTPVDLNDHLSELLRSQRDETDEAVKKMITDDFDKAYQFMASYRELEFFITIKSNDEKTLENAYLELYGEFDIAGFRPKQLQKKDYANYIAYIFENPLINDYYFSRGVFSCLNQKYEYNDEKKSYSLTDYTDNLAIA